MLFIALLPLRIIAQIDMQAHVGSDEGKAAYPTYTTRQTAYYSGSYTYSSLISLTNDALFGALNARMGDPCRLNQSGYNYSNLPDNYKNVDRDLNTSGNIIGYYNGQSFIGVWDSGKTWNREHTWPQSKGADDGIDMGHDMQSVRPASTSVNSSRGNTAYGESGSYYDPNEIAISNGNYKTTNLGTYRGDAARVIMTTTSCMAKQGGTKTTIIMAMPNCLVSWVRTVSSNPSTSCSSGICKTHHHSPRWCATMGHKTTRATAIR